MPGIVGIVGRGVADDFRRVVASMLGTMKHAPDYASGTYSNAELGVYAGWVAHPGSFAARQSDAREGRPVLLFSGDGFAEPAHEALTPLELYEERGERFVESLDGSFSGLLADPVRRRCLLFNDRFGQERIYYHETDGAIFFASEAKALLAVLPHLRSFDEEGVVQFLTYGTTLPEKTLFRGVRLMPQGSIWTFEGGARSASRSYFTPAQLRQLPELTSEEFREGLATALSQAVRSCFGTDLPAGISITGGLDTRMIMACLPELTRDPVCYTFAGIQGETLDVRIGRRVAHACGLEHHTLRIGPEFLAKYGELVDRTAFITDGCAGALGAHEIYLNAQARQLAPVRVTGNFGSEILRGMSTFKSIGLCDDLLEPGLRARVAAQRASEAAPEPHPVLFAAFHEIPSVHYGIPAAARSQLTFRSPFLRNGIVELAARSPARERSSHAASAAVIERYRPKLAEIPTDRGVLPAGGHSGRYASRAFAEITFKLDYWHKEGLPRVLGGLEPVLELLNRVGWLGLHKFLPYRGWYRRELAGYVKSVLSDASTRRMPFWNASALDRILEDHQRGRRNHLPEIHAILTLESVNRCLLGMKTDTVAHSRSERPCEV